MMMHRHRSTLTKAIAAIDTVLPHPSCSAAELRKITIGNCFMEWESNFKIQ